MKAYPETAVHVVPIDDLREHVDTGEACWCEPSIQMETDERHAVIVHHSADGRELVERYGVQ